MGHRVDQSEISRQESEAFKVAPSNWDSVMAFLACDTQWRVVALPSRLSWIGLDYAGVDVVLRRFEFPSSVFSDLQVMEHAALSVLEGNSA
ncbi:DUF1799 domain-containing protein [Rhizobium aquaticum]|uniref:DUF1799 domain-containing protein n=1 Tax=Rhizobium aquaticum TaxID=1549636 RepID=UPI003397503E